MTSQPFKFGAYWYFWCEDNHRHGPFRSKVHALTVRTRYQWHRYRKMYG